jgi:hypothetical protein
MDLRGWLRYLRGRPRLDALVDRASGPEAAPVFMIGSALSLAEESADRGVPGVRGMVAEVRARVLRENLNSGEFEDLISRAEEAGNSGYEAAFAYLESRRGPGAVNDVIRTAVLRARKPGALQAADDAALERDLDGWALTRGTRAFGELLAHYREKYPGPTLTTNFDPLLWVAVKKAGGMPRRVVLDGDGSLPSTAESDQDEQLIVHLHGYWRDSDTHHTGTELTAERRLLSASLGRLLNGRLVVVVGYGGWDDAFMGVVSSLLCDPEAKPDIAWALYDENPGELIENQEALLGRFDQWQSRGRINFYVGINAHDLFEQLLSRAATPLRPPSGSTSGSVRKGRDQQGKAGGPHGQASPAPAKAGRPAPPASTPPPAGPPARTSPRAAIASLLQEAAEILDRFVAPQVTGQRAGPVVAGRSRTVLRASLVDVEVALGALGEAGLKSWPDKGFVVKIRKPRKSAWDQLAELRCALDEDRNADAEFRRLAATLKQVRDLIRQRVPGQGRAGRSRR